MKLHASYVSVHDFGGLHFQVSFDTEAPDAEDANFDLSVLEQPYLLIQRQFEDENEEDGVCYIETHEPSTYAGHFRLHLIELTTTRLLFEIDRPTDRMVEVTFALDRRRFREVERILGIIFGAKA